MSIYHSSESSSTVYTQIPYEDIKVQANTGQGASGFVKRALWGKLTVAVKYLYDSSGIDTEIDNLKRVFGGKNIIRVMDSPRTSTDIWGL
jgi:hypothetical protein